MAKRPEKQLTVKEVHTTLERLCEQTMELRLALAHLGRELKGTKKLAARHVREMLDKHHKCIIESIRVMENEYGATPTPPQEQKLYCGETEF